MSDAFTVYSTGKRAPAWNLVGPPCRRPPRKRRRPYHFWNPATPGLPSSRHEEIRLAAQQHAQPQRQVDTISLSMEVATRRVMTMRRERQRIIFILLSLLCAATAAMWVISHHTTLWIAYGHAGASYQIRAVNGVILIGRVMLPIEDYQQGLAPAPPRSLTDG